MHYLSTDETLRAQHLAVRSGAGWYDFTHRILEVTGKDALAFLEKMYVANLSRLKVGGARYTTAVNEDGLIVEDVIVFRMEEEKYWVSTLYMRDMIRRFKEYDAGYDISYTDITSAWRMYSVQGPKSTALVNAVVDAPIDDLKFFNIRDNTIDGIPVKVARSGYTGEKIGYEIYIAIDKRDALEAKLAERAEEVGATHITEIDAMVMTLPAEVGFVLMLDIYKTTPFEIGAERSIDWSKDFVGKDALNALKDKEPARRLIGFTVEDDEALIYGGPHGAEIKKDGKIIGRATKYTYGYTCSKNIGYALIDTAHAKIGDKITINGYDALLTERKFI